MSRLNDKCPCRYCGDRRTIGCHGTCKDYIDWAVERKRELAFEREMIMKHPIINKNAFTGTSPKPGHCRRTKGSKH